MNILGSSRTRCKNVSDYIKPMLGNTIFDMGCCGPVLILDYLPDDVKYTGTDFNSDYIQSARIKYSSKGEFIHGNVSEHKEYSFKESFDIVIAIGVIHHLSNDDATKLLATVYDCLKKDGRFISLDNVYDKKLSIVNKIALKCDRAADNRKKSNYLQKFLLFLFRIEKFSLRLLNYNIIYEVKIV